MLATIWTCTHEWSLIARRLTAFTFETCHQRLDLLVLVDPVDERGELAVRARRHVDAHLRDRFARRQAGLSLGLLGDRLVDALLGLGVELDTKAELRRLRSVPLPSDP